MLSIMECKKIALLNLKGDIGSTKLQSSLCVLWVRIMGIN